jgi:hypothetical protein
MKRTVVVPNGCSGRIFLDDAQLTTPLPAIAKGQILILILLKNPKNASTRSA